MNIPDHFSGSLETIYGLKILKFFDEDSATQVYLCKNAELVRTEDIFSQVY